MSDVPAVAPATSAPPVATGAAPTVVPGSPPPVSTPAGADGSTPGQSATQAPVAQTTEAPKAPVDTRPFLTEMDRVFAQVQEPTPPKDYSAEAFAAYQQQVSGAQRNRDFQNSVREAVLKPIAFGDGVSFNFSSQEEVRQFVNFISEVSSGQRQISGRDLVALWKMDHLLSMAREHGSRQYETGLRRSAGAPGVQAGPPVTPKIEPPTTATQSSGRAPSVREILQKSDPDFYKKFVGGEIRIQT